MQDKYQLESHLLSHLNLSGVSGALHQNFVKLRTLTNTMNLLKIFS